MRFDFLLEKNVCECIGNENECEFYAQHVLCLVQMRKKCKNLLENKIFLQKIRFFPLARVLYRITNSSFYNQKKFNNCVYELLTNIFGNNKSIQKIIFDN